MGGENKPSVGSSTHTTSSEEEAPLDQLIVWKKPEKSQEDYQKWLKDFRTKNGEVDTSTSCGSCDNSLKLLTGPGVKTFIQTEVVKGTTSAGTTSPVTGEDEVIYFSRNYVEKHKKPGASNTSVKTLTSTVNPGKPVRVAVLDTGLDPEESKNHAYNNEGDCCTGGAEKG